MANKNKQYYGVKFPFTANNLDGFFVDLNEGIDDKVASEIVHVILTPKRSRIRKPDFGTDLIKFVFEPNDNLTWESVVAEVSEAVSKYVPKASIDDLNIVYGTEDPNAIYLDIRYSVKYGNMIENKRMVVKL